MLSRKGTPTHRRMGRAYLAAMLVLNTSALTIYEDSPGSLGVFHYLSFLSLATLAAGLASNWLGRSLGAVMVHGHFMAWSYVGLVAAGAGQAASALSAPVGASIIGILLIGGALVHTRVPRARFSAAGVS